jgi:hypothetical protein
VTIKQLSDLYLLLPDAIETFLLDLDISNRSQAAIGLRCYTNNFDPFRF